jgi:hypothetical protein
MDLDASVLYHPTTLQIIEVATIVWALGFTCPNSLGLRLGALGGVAACVWGIIVTAPEHLRTAWGAFAGGAACFTALHYLDVGVIRRYQCASRILSAVC